MNILTMSTNAINVLGRLGENDYTQARFDVDAWLSEYPAGQITLLNQRSGDTDAYPVAGVSVSGSTVLWTVSDTDLSKEGVGRCELIMLVDGVVAKSAIYMTKVLPALDGSGEAPEPWESWQTEFAALRDEAVAAADDAEAASEAVQDIVISIFEEFHYGDGLIAVIIALSAESGDERLRECPGAYGAEHDG